MSTKKEKARKEGGIVVTEEMSGSDDGGDGGEAEPGGGGVGIGVSGDGDRVGSVVVVMVGCPPEANAVEGTTDINFWRDGI